jgi:hypothetical protein
MIREQFIDGQAFLLSRKGNKQRVAEMIPATRFYMVV